jgi:hypothetical protein
MKSAQHCRSDSGSHAHNPFQLSVLSATSSLSEFIADMLDRRLESGGLVASGETADELMQLARLVHYVIRRSIQQLLA